MKIFKSGCQCEHYRLAAEGMKALLGFLSVCAVELLQVTYLHRNQPDAPAVEILSPLQIQVLKARFPKSPPVLTVAWAIESIAFLGGYLEHRRKSPIGIQFLWRGWLIYVNFAKAGFLLNFILNGKSMIVNNCCQDIDVSRIPSFTAGTNLVMNWSKIKTILRSIAARNYPDLLKSLDDAFNSLSPADFHSWFTNSALVS